MKKIKCVFIIIVLLIIVELFYLFTFQLSNNEIKTQKAFILYPTPSLTIPPWEEDFDTARMQIKEYQVLYKKVDDNEGRTILYESQNKFLTLTGVGERYYTEGSRSGTLRMIVGNFDRWENIDKSSDRIMVLKNPITNTEIKKVRVSFGTTTSCFKILGDSTQYAFEGLKEGMAKKVNKIKNFSLEELSYWIKQDDAIIIVPILQNDNNYTPIVDKSGVICALTIFGRRYSINEL